MVLKETPKKCHPGTLATEVKQDNDLGVRTFSYYPYIFRTSVQLSVNLSPSVFVVAGVCDDNL